MYGDSGLARHDLLASLIIDEFNWENVLGGRLCLLSDVASCVGIFASRTLKFRVTTDNNIAKTISYGKYQIPTIVNKGDPYEQS